MSNKKNLGMLPQEYIVNHNDILVDKGTYSYSSNFIKEFGDEKSSIEIDVSITTSSLEYLFDIETKVDFLTN